MIRFFEKLDRSSRSVRLWLWLTARRKNIVLAVGAASMLVAGLAMSDYALGFQSNSSQSAAVRCEPGTKKTSGEVKSAQQKKLTESRIAELRAFAKAHHPEIMPLLDLLEKKRPKKFSRVMAGLNRNVTNLERLKKRSPEAYQRGLAAWINQSRIQLYAAQFKVAADDKTAKVLQEKIRVLLGENIDARLHAIERDVAAAKERIARLEKSAEDIKAKRDAVIEKRLTTATKRAPKINKDKKKKREPKDKASEKHPEGE